MPREECRRFNTPELSIQTIASVSRVAWRPGFENQIASCASVLDNRVQIWTTQHPHAPLACVQGHGDVTTGFVWINQSRSFPGAPDPQRRVAPYSKNTSKGILTSLSEARLFDKSSTRSRALSGHHKRHQTDSFSIARQAYIASTTGSIFDGTPASPRRHTSDNGHIDDMFDLSTDWSWLMTCSKDTTMQLSDVSVALQPMDMASSVSLTLSTRGDIAAQYENINRSGKAIMSRTGLLPDHTVQRCRASSGPNARKTLAVVVHTPTEKKRGDGIARFAPTRNPIVIYPGVQAEQFARLAQNYCLDPGPEGALACKCCAVNAVVAQNAGISMVSAVWQLIEMLITPDGNARFGNSF